jgi:hypothetical protein
MNGWYCLFLGLGGLLVLYVVGYIAMYRTSMRLMRHHVRLARQRPGGEPIRIDIGEASGFDAMNLCWIFRVAVKAEYPGRLVYVVRRGSVLEAHMEQ